MADANSLSDFMKTGHIFGNGLPPQSSAVALGRALTGQVTNRLPATQWATADGQGIDPALAYSIGAPGANQGTGAVQAIDQAAPPMNWEASNPAQAPSGDVWSGLRNPGEASVPQSGITTANTGRNIASYLPAGSPISGLFTGGLGGMFANTPIGKLIGGLGALGGTNRPTAAPTGLAGLPKGPVGVAALANQNSYQNAFGDSGSAKSGSGGGASNGYLFG